MMPVKQNWWVSMSLSEGVFKGSTWIFSPFFRFLQLRENSSCLQQSFKLYSHQVWEDGTHWWIKITNEMATNFDLDIMISSLRSSIAKDLFKLLLVYSNLW
jgi:hypothetical protein